MSKNWIMLQNIYNYLSYKISKHNLFFFRSFYSVYFRIVGWVKPNKMLQINSDRYRIKYGMTRITAIKQELIKDSCCSILFGAINCTLQTLNARD